MAVDPEVLFAVPGVHGFFAANVVAVSREVFAQGLLTSAGEARIIRFRLRP